MTNISDLAAYQAYRFFDSLGNAYLSVSVYNFVWDKENPYSMPKLVGFATASKIVSLVSFHSHRFIRDTQPHPFSGISYPGVFGISSANIVYLVGGGSQDSKAVGTIMSFVAGGLLHYANFSHVYHPPSTFLYANSFVSEERHILDESYHDNSEYALALAGTIVMSLVPFFDIRRMVDKPITEMGGYQQQHCLRRIKTVFFNALCLAPSIAHLTSLNNNPGYRYLYLNSHQLMLQNAPYLSSMLALAFFEFLRWI